MLLKKVLLELGETLEQPQEFYTTSIFITKPGSSCRETFFEYSPAPGAYPYRRVSSLLLQTQTNIIEKQTMKAVVIGEPSGATMETIMIVYPKHKAIVDKYIAKGEVIGIGPFDDRGNMAIFKTRAAAEQFVTEDPFILEGLVKSFSIRDWNDNMLPE